MSMEHHKTLIRRFYDEVWNRGNMEVADEIFAADYVRHDLRPSNLLPGPAGQKQNAAAFRAAFPDCQFVLDLLVAETDIVVARWTATGTNIGQWRNIPPTGKPVKFSGVNIFRISNGKVVEIWNYRDDLGLMQQLGGSISIGST